MSWKRPEISHGVPTKYGWTVWFPERLTLGVWTDIGAACLIFCHFPVYIGDGVQIGSRTAIYTKNTIDGTEGPVKIGTGSGIGTNSTIFPGVTIGEGAVIGAHSLVKCDIPAGETWAGIPARKINV